MINVTIQNTAIGDGNVCFSDVSGETAKKIMELLVEDFELD